MEARLICKERNLLRETLKNCIVLPSITLLVDTKPDTFLRNPIHCLLVWKNVRKLTFRPQIKFPLNILFSFFLYVRQLKNLGARSHWAFALAIALAMSQTQTLKWVLYPISNGVANAIANTQCE